MDILSFILIGLIAGALAGRVVSGHGYGVLGDIVVGMARLLLHDPARSGSRGGDEARIPRQSEQPIAAVEIDVDIGR